MFFSVVSKPKLTHVSSIICGNSILFLRRAVKMERKNYSFSKPIPRQTLWNLKQRRKQEKTVSTSVGDGQFPSGNSSRQQHVEKTQLRPPKQKKEKIIEPVEDSQCASSSLIGEQLSEDLRSINDFATGKSLISTKSHENQHSALPLVPHLKPFRNAQSEYDKMSSDDDDDDDDDDELFGNRQDPDSDSEN